MNGYERIFSLLSGQTPDRLPCMPITMMFAADCGGVPYGQYVRDYRLLVESQLATARKFGFDYVSVISDPARESADLGALIRFFENSPPALDEAHSLLSDLSRLDTLVPVEPMSMNGRMADRVRAAESFRHQVGGEFFIEGWVEGPCALGADLRGINHLMTDFMMNPDFVERLFAFCTEQALLFAGAQIRAGVDIVGVGDAAASLVGPKLYRKFVYPFEKKLIEGIHELGGRVRLHICGNTTKILPESGTLGADMIDLDSMVSVAAAREVMGPDQILTGNINPVATVLNGTPELIQSQLQQCLHDAGGNYIVAAGCEIPRGTPEENVREIVRFAERNGYVY